MRALHVTRDLAPRTNGGLSTAVAGMMGAMRRTGVTVAAVSFDGWRPRSQADVGPPDVSTPGVLRLTAPSQLDAARAWALAWAPEVVWVHDALLWDFAHAVAAATRASTAYELHVLHVEMNRIRGVEDTRSGRAEVRAVAQADAVFAPSLAVAARVPRAVHAPLGVDLPPPADPGPRPARLLSVGRFGDIKGTDRLLELLPEVLSAVPKASAAIAGGLPDSGKADRRWRRRFAALPADVRDRVELLGWLGPADLERAYAAARVLVVPSRFETFGQVALEAMARGVVVAATPVGGLPEVVGEEGLLAPVEDLAAACVGLLRDDAKAARLANAAVQAARTRGDWSPGVAARLSAIRRRGLERG